MDSAKTAINNLMGYGSNELVSPLPLITCDMER